MGSFSKHLYLPARKPPISLSAKYKLTLPPAYLPEWGSINEKTYFENGQELLLGKRKVPEVAKQWADLFNAAQKKFNAAK